MKERGSVFVAFALVFLFVLSVGVVSAFWPFTTTGKVTDDYSTSAQIIISDARVYDGLIDYTSVGADNIKTPIKAVTVGGWFNTEALRIGNNEITGSWVSKRNSYILSAETDGSVKFWVFLDDTWYYVSSPTNSVSLNVWEHWVGIWDGSTISLYKNGELVASTPASGTLGTTGDLCIGHDCGLSAPYDNRYFKGSLKDLRVYIDALSASAVKKLYVEKKDAPSDETASCTDSDNGLNVDKYGWTNFTSNSFRFIHDDECALVSNYNSSGEPVGWQSATSCSGNDCYVEEAFCRTDDNGNFNDADADELIPCPNGCSMGSCATSGGSGNSTSTCSDTNSVKEGTPVKVKLGNKDYDISINFISSSKVKLSVNGIILDVLYRGDILKLNDGTYIGIEDILKQDLAGSIGNVDFILSDNKECILNRVRGGSGNSCLTIGCSLPSSDGSNKCIAFGTRTGGNYCALSGTMNAQGASEATCENNYECGSNVCASGKCVDAGLFQKIIDFFRKLFGGEGC